MPPRLAVFIAVVLWGISFVATKAVLRQISPITLIFTRFALGTGLLWLILASRRAPARIPRTAWPSLVLMGFIGIFVHQMLQAYALRLTSAVNTGWLIGLTPIWSALLAAVVLRERFSVMKTTGLILGFLGALLVITKGRISTDMISLPSTRGDLMILISTLNWAIYSVLGHRTIKSLGALRATAGAMLAGWLMLAPFFIFANGWREYPHLTPGGWGSILFLGIGCSGLGYFFWYGALERIEASRVAAFLYLEPPVTFLAAIILLGEPVGLLTVVGGLIVLAGVLLVQRAP